jgi:hypothetical protein
MLGQRDFENALPTLQRLPRWTVVAVAARSGLREPQLISGRSAYYFRPTDSPVLLSRLQAWDAERGHLRQKANGGLAGAIRRVAGKGLDARAADAMLMMHPPPVVCMAAIACLVPRNAPSRLVCMTRRQSSRGLFCRPYAGRWHRPYPRRSIERGAQGGKN